MGRKLDLSGLTDSEAEHVLQVVQRDMRLRKKEEQRLSELKQELDEESSRCLLLSRRSCFNQRCCIRCCSPFTFLLNPKRRCCECHYNVCKACRVFNKQDKAWLCSTCQRSRLLKTQSLEWFYTNVKTRFKRFGSAKVLKTLYRKHLAEHSTLAELTESCSTYEGSVCNEGSFCGSDSTFYRQTQEHSIAETITVALRVAEEAIDEAISKAEVDTASQERQSEADYLREHRGELIEELSKTIVQKIVSRRKTLNELRADYDQDWPLEHNTDLDHQPDFDQASISLKHRPDLWRSHSTSTLLDNDPPGLIQDSSQALKKDGVGSAMSTWKSVDRLDSAGVYGGVSSVLKSPDGNWIALQSAQLSRPSLLTRRKSLVFSALEKESEVVSAYEVLGSDDKTKAQPEPHDRIPSPLTGSREDLFSEAEGKCKPNKPLMAFIRRRLSVEIGHPLPSRRTSISDVNFSFRFNEDPEEEDSKVAAKPGKVRRTRKKRRRKDLLSCVSDYREKDNYSPHPSNAGTPATLTSGTTTPDPFHLDSDITGHETNQMEQELTLKLQQLAVSQVSDAEVDGEMREADGHDGHDDGQRQGSENRDEDNMRLWMKLDKERTEEHEEVDENMKYRLYRLIAQSRLTYLSTDDDLDRDDQSEGEWDGNKNEDVEVEKTDGLASKLCQLEKQVKANQFSSTEDELDRVGIEDKEKKTAGEEEELAVRVCRLANEVSDTQFSSTEDELERTGRSEEGEDMIDEKLWKLQTERDGQADQLRNLASLLSASQFSSTEDELDRERVRENELEVKITDLVTEREEAVGKDWERRESFGDLDVKMFDLRDEIEEINMESKDEKVSHTPDKTDEEENKDYMEEIMAQDETIVKGPIFEEKVELLQQHKAKRAKETQEIHKTELKTVVQEERIEEIISSHETKTQKENEPEAKRPDREEEEEKQEEERKDSQNITADSDEEDEEFDRIINSMLMMTLEDMQVKDNATGNGSINGELKEVETDENVKPEIDGTIDEGVNAQSTNAPEARSATEFQSRCDNVMPESSLRERPEDVRDLTGADTFRKNQSGGAPGPNENELQERKPPNAQEKEKLESEETLETCNRKEVNDEEQEHREVLTEWDMMADQGCAAERERESGKLNEVLGDNTDNMEQSITSSLQEDYLLSPEEILNRYSAVSLRSITTEVLKLLNATEELLLQGAEGGDCPPTSHISLPPNTDPKKLDQQFSGLEEKVYVAAGEVYSLEVELSDLEECARSVCTTTSDMELSFLEEQVASAAAKIQQSELQVCDISARIAALKSAGLNVATSQSRVAKTIPDVTVDSSRQLRRRLPAPPTKDCHLEERDGL